MFSFSFRLNGKRIACAAAVVCFLCAACVCARFSRRPPSVSAVDAAEEPAEDAVVRRHVAFLNACGWRVRPEPLSVVAVRIPAVFGPVYERYNRLQLAQGCDLSAYKGRLVVKYVYELVSYPGAAEGDVYANVLEADGAVIGGDISSVRIDGFMHGFHGETDGYDQT